MSNEMRETACAWVERTAHGGNLRLFSGAPPWQDAYAASIPGLAIVAENAFGLQFCRDEAGMAYALDPESRAVEDVGHPFEALMRFVDEDPAYALDQDLYEECCAALGTPGAGERFAFVHPIALGGTPEPGNVRRLPGDDHMAFLAALSAQIAGDPPGTRYHPVRADEA